jgi:hypothetical protein
MNHFRTTAMLAMLLAGATTLTVASGGSPKVPPVPLKITVNATQQFDPLTGTPTYVTSDSLGPYYIDGQNGVCAKLNDLGLLYIMFDCSSVSTPRHIGVVLTNFLANPTGGTNTCAPPPSISPDNPPIAYTNYLLTSEATDMPTTAFQNMLQYDSTNPKTIYYMQLDFNYKMSDSTNTVWNLDYHKTINESFADAALGSYAEVRRLSPTRWVVESVTPSHLGQNQPNAAMLIWTTSSQHSSTRTECGFYQVPFSFTLDAK